ncbi:hypothetical protein NBRC116188_18610 [Oceaniserpentilla sp. 4NH20-0058]|uniref:hypothetical protein n=1 Tax=Oceaniserpentilla sp. 4NH20-0058 TaxID=3127660 RepID=UPI003107E844
MKIAVIGTSNSVQKNNYVTALSQDHEVHNLSSGRVSYYAHIKTILKNIALLKTMDLIIVDHYINDVNVYSLIMDEKYKERLPLFYSLLSEIGVPILNYLSAIDKIKDEKGYWFYELVNKLSENFSFNLLDLNKIDFTDGMFADPIHLKREVSYLIGMQLSNYLLHNELQCPLPPKNFKNPFALIGEKHLREYPECEEFEFQNSLLKISCFRLKDEIILPDNGELISIGYFNYEAEENLFGVSLNGVKYELEGERYYHEVAPNLTGPIVVSPLKGRCEDVYSLVERTDFSKPDEMIFDYPAITEFLYLKFPEYKIDLPDGKGNPLLIKNLQENINLVCSPFGMEVQNKEIRWIRNAAFSLEGVDSKLSFKLLRIIRRYRPADKVAMNKLWEIRDRLKGITE